MTAATSSSSSSAAARQRGAPSRIIDPPSYDVDIVEAAERIVCEYEASQEPRIRIEPEGAAHTDGPDAALLCETYWFSPDPWQRTLMDCWLSRDSEGRLLCITAGLSVPRQNGKTGAIEAMEFYLLVTDPSAHILHTAHSVKTVKKAFNRLSRVFTHPGRKWKPIRDLVAAVRRTNGEERIEMKSGATIEYSARSTNSGRGFDNITLIVYDEAQALNDTQLEAMNQALAASATGDRQVIYAGTPPSEKVDGGVFRRRRHNILSSPTRRSAWHEWSVEERPSDEAAWEDVLPLLYMTNPSMEVGRPGTLSEEYTFENEWSSLTADGFARERLGWWDPEMDRAAEATAIDPEVWSRTAIDAIGKRYQGVSALAVKFSPDGATWALAGCKMRRDRSGCAFELIELGDTARGTRPLAEAIARRRNTHSTVWVDGANGADALCANLAEMALPRGYVVRMRSADVVAAAQGLVDGLVDGTVSHVSCDGQAALDDAAATATKRDIGRSGGWGFDGSIELEACAAAVMGARTTKRDPKRKQRLL